MGNCIYCGNSAGFLRKQHGECRQAAENAKKAIGAAVQEALHEGMTIERARSVVDELAQRAHLPGEAKRDVIVDQVSAVIDQFLEDGVLDQSEENRIAEFQDKFSLSQRDFARTGAVEKVVKAATLRDVMNGELPDRLALSGPVPFNLQKGEKIVWAFPNAEYLEDKTRRQYVGGSQGVSIRIAKGVYYRAGAFKGHSVERTERVSVGKGLLALSNKHVLFSCADKTLRIPYSKIVSFQPFSDGIAIMRDAASAKPQVFVTGDGWFTYNLASNLSQIAA